ncbi:branched-chain amino acid transport system II carrier protein [Antarcticibacterium flavum]|uniref:Branched-chain amino acid transport system II carrier protein n=1 Tax=Antarcticibacterium flavum TaxID=2058175 RepID=A0A5B7X374_9FLAO|nr:MULTISPECIES: branched-chain amino acid transport system II carrier protein [Antarcticibacterium]MCM4160569.1 branched-chain amino acid transport system II carrier protein [Antarcticibacterium sp. W02-3]QCY69769.1 branched-chain amino acid transport system II carrier protein [Antarcticibacterium flavum]
MKFNKETLILGFALFALFFGAGNLILPPALGFFAGSQWYLVAIGFILSAVGLPLLGIVAHARLQGSILDFGNRVSPVFSLIFSILIYLISISLPAPRTAAVTHEIAVEPFFEVGGLFTSIIYFTLVLFFVIKRSQVINNIGKYLTPTILVLLLVVIVKSLFPGYSQMKEPETTFPVLSGFFEGYQTFDAIAALVVGGVILISVKLKRTVEPRELQVTVTTAAVLAGLALLIVYSGLIYTGARVNGEFSQDISRVQLLSGISILNLGNFGGVALALLVTLACFTTAVGIVTGTADFMATTIKKPGTYPFTVVVACVLGVIMGAFSVNQIIDIALPVLMVIYPLTIILILLNVLPERYRSRRVMRSVVLVTVILSLPDVLKIYFTEEQLQSLLQWVPLSSYNLGWVLPAIITFTVVNLLEYYWENKTLPQK